MFKNYLSHSAHLHPCSGSWTAGLHSLNVTRPVSSHHKPPTNCITHDLQIHRGSETERCSHVKQLFQSVDVEMLTYCECLLNVGSSWSLQLLCAHWSLQD